MVLRRRIKFVIQTLKTRRREKLGEKLKEAVLIGISCDSRYKYVTE